MLRECLLGICLGISVLGPSGCVVLTPSPAVEALNALGAAASGAISVMPTSSLDTQVVHLHRKISSVCIEFNPNTEVSDFVPALQAALLDQDVKSRVYASPGQFGDCQATVDYVAYIEWGKKMFSDSYSSYLVSAVINLRENDKVLASVSYRLSDRDFGKWASTYNKIKPAVRALLVNNK